VEALRKAPTHSAPGIDGWRYEHLKGMIESQDSRNTLTAYFQTIARADVPTQIADFLATALLVPFMKDSPAVDAAKREAAHASGIPYIPPCRPITIGGIFSRAVTAAALRASHDALVEALGPTNICFKVPNGMEIAQWLCKIALQENPECGILSLDAKNAFNACSRDKIWNAVCNTPGLEPLKPLIRMLYMDREADLLYYPAGQCFPQGTLHSKEGTRQGCVLGMVLFCLLMVPLVAWINSLEPDACLALNWADDAPIICTPRLRDIILEEAPAKFLELAGITINQSKTTWGRPLNDSHTAPPSGRPPDYKVCEASMIFGVPVGTHDACKRALYSLAERHAKILALCRELAVDHPHAAMRLLQEAGVNRFQHASRACDPTVTSNLLEAADNMIFQCLLDILHIESDPHAPSLQIPRLRAQLGVSMGGLNLPSVRREAELCHYSSLAAVARPLHDMMTMLPGGIAASVASGICAVASSTSPWAVEILSAHTQVLHMGGISPSEANTVQAIAPRGAPTFRAGDSSAPSMLSCPETYAAHIPDPGDLYKQCHPSLQKDLSKISKTKAALGLINSLNGRPETMDRLYTSSFGGISFANSDCRQVHDQQADVYKFSIARSLGMLPRCPRVDKCPSCLVPLSLLDNTADYPAIQAANDHFGRCGVAGNPQFIHRAVVSALQQIIISTGCVAKKHIVLEAASLRDDLSRPADILLQHLDGVSRHVAVDVSVAGVFISSQAMGPRRPGAAAAKREHKKWSDDLAAQQSIVRDKGFRLVPFVLEEGGRLGIHAWAFLQELDKARRAKLTHLPTRHPKRLAQHHVWRQILSGKLHAVQSSLALEAWRQASAVV
jgi:hypothetical protein